MAGIFDNLYRLGDVALGSLVPDKEHPNEESQDPPLLVLDTDYNKRSEIDYGFSVKSYSKSFIGLMLTKFIAADGQRKREDEFYVKTAERNVYTLRSPKAVIRKICDDKRTQFWLEDNIGGKVHMVTEIYTLTDPKLFTFRSSGTKAGAKVLLPFTSATVGTSAGDGKIKAGHEGKHERSEQMQAVGERIYQIRYKKVKLVESLIKAATGTAAKEITGTVPLGPGCWYKIIPVRGSHDEGSLVVEVDLEDDRDEDEDEGLDIGAEHGKDDGKD